MNKRAVILYFVDGPMPTAEQFAEGQSMPAQVKYRNAQQVPESGALEAADGVAGNVPSRYAEVYPDAETAIKNVDKANKAELKRAGEVRLPEVNKDIPLIPASGADTTGQASGNTMPVPPNTALKPKAQPGNTANANPRTEPTAAAGWKPNAS